MRSRERSSYFSSIIRESFQSITRNSLMSTAAAVSIIAAMLILGVFLIFSANIAKMTQTVENNLEIKVFLKEGVSEAQKEVLYQALLADPNVEDVRYESKREALDNFSNSLKDYTGLLDSYTDENNPMPESYIVKATSGDKLAEIKEAAAAHTDSVEYVKYEENFITSLMKFNNFINFFSISLMIVMSVIALFLIYNTIRLTVVNRRREIEIMKYIGATDSFIQTPFVLEGTFLGVISAVFALLLIRVVYYYLLGIVNGSVMTTLQSSFVSPGFLMWIIFGCFMVYGIIVGAAGAVIATRKYLNV